MTDPPQPHDGQSFADVLSAVIQRAYDSGVTVEGGWKCTIDGNGDSHWDVQITRVEYED